jgi:hypothetical protein
VSNDPPYGKYVGRSFRLPCDCALWDDGFSPPLVVVPEGHYARPQEQAVARLPRGTTVKLEAVQRERTYLLWAGGGWARQDTGLVSFEDPVNPGKRVQARAALPYLGITESAEGASLGPRVDLSLPAGPD